MRHLADLFGSPLFWIGVFFALLGAAGIVSAYGERDCKLACAKSVRTGAECKELCR